MAPSDDTQAQLESIETRLLQLAEDLLMDQIKEDEYALLSCSEVEVLLYRHLLLYGRQY